MNAIVLQCGGPSPVLNASLWGVISACQGNPAITELWGARSGWRGLIDGQWVALTAYRNQGRLRLETQPGAALGSGRDRLSDEELPVALAHFQQYRISLVFVIGGNGSMAAAHKLYEYTRHVGYRVDGIPLRIIGIPKTIDNDLSGCDFAPGYGSAANFIARTTYDVSLDLSTMRGFDDVAVMEVMGRHTGWLAAAAGLARLDQDSAPHLILLPEVPFDEEGFLSTVRQYHTQNGTCLVVTAEGVREPSGEFLAEKTQNLERDKSGQKLLSYTGGASSYLAGLVINRLGLRSRQIRPDTIQRSSRNLTSQVDRKWAIQTGFAAVEAGLDNNSDVMVSLVRRIQEPEWDLALLPLNEIAGREKPLPPNFIGPAFDVTPAFLAYARPLIDDWQPEVISPLF